MPLAFLFAVAQAAAAVPLDFPALDEAIERCDRATVLPIFAGEPHRRSAFLTTFYGEQAAISSERLTVADKRRLLREAALPIVAGEAARTRPTESDQELALAQLALEDRQRALDDRRRLETLRQQAIDMKRQYFLTHCPSGKKKGD